MGRYITADPAQEGLNLYTYVFNNPNAFVDPEGLCVLYEPLDWAKTFWDWLHGDFSWWDLLGLTPGITHGMSRGLRDAAERGKLLTRQPSRPLQPYHPPNRGFSGKPDRVTLPPGTVIDRYGGPSGKFTAPKGTPIGARSLPPGADNRPLNAYVVQKPLPANSGTTAPWFGQFGGGTQYEFDSPINDLIDQGYLSRQ